MSLLGKKFPGALAKPMTPFFAAGLIVLYGVNSLQNVLSNTQIRLDSTLDTAIVMPWFQERHSHSPIPVQQSHSRNQQLTLDFLAAEFKNDPRNPNAKSGKADH
ncbi:hypothetical protein N7528_009474 [Penicillium herquei]|nr:hypothetical protein N7528_009474 [Penicillium herquei]